MPSAINRDDATRLADDLAVLAEPHRLQVLCELRGGPQSAGALARATGMAPSLASHHLAVLLKAGLVSRWRDGSFVYYKLDQSRAGEIQQWLARVLRPLPGGRTGRNSSHAQAVPSRGP
ncbi:MAG: metalloregulator ArsR/SmtB family transcription factor [Actinomycetota bacterium]|jgi:DNA-binding transcriptional ArsR family regulator